MKRLGWFLLMVVCTYAVIRVRFFYFDDILLAFPFSILGWIDIFIFNLIMFILISVAFNSFTTLFFDLNIFVLKQKIKELQAEEVGKEKDTTFSDPD